MKSPQKSLNTYMTNYLKSSLPQEPQIYGLKKIFVFIFFSLCLMPYFTIGITISDVQPWYAVIGWALLLSHRNLKFTYFETIFLIFSFIYIFALDFYGVDNLISVIRKQISILFLFPVLVLTRLYGNYLNGQLIFYVSLVYLFFVVSQIFFPSLYDALGIFFNQKVTEIGARGISGMMAEPTDFGFFSMCMIVLAMLKKKSFTSTSKYYFTLGLFIFFGLITFSGSAYVTLFLILLLLFFQSRISTSKKIFILIASALGLIILFSSLIEIRGFSILTSLLTDPLFVINNTSFSYRFYSNLVAIFYFFDSYGVGCGVGCMDSVALPVIEKYSLFNNLDNLYYKQQLLEFFSQEQPNSIFSELVFHTGILGVIFLTCIFIKLIKNNTFGKKFIILVFFLYLMQSFPLLFPIPWLLLALKNE